MFICDVYQAYLDDDTDELPFPCENCAAWIEKTDTCLCEERYNEEIEKLNAAKTAYSVTKAINPIKTTPKEGVNIPTLIKVQFPDYYNYFNKYFDWNDLDGILDFLYFHAKILHITEAQQLIDLIEAHCEVKK